MYPAYRPVSIGGPSGASGQLTGSFASAVALVELLDRVDRAVDAAATRVVNRLVAAGLAQHFLDPDDRRGSWSSLPRRAVRSSRG